MMIVLVKTPCFNRGRSFPVGAFNKGLTNCKGVSLTFSKEYLAVQDACFPIVYEHVHIHTC